MIRELKAINRGKWTLTYRDVDDGTIYREEFEDEDHAFHAASKLVAFSDCYPVDHVRVRHFGRSYKYAGWQPGMKIEFVDVVSWLTRWIGYYPEWDH